MRFLDTTKATINDDSLDGFRLRMIHYYRDNKAIYIRDDIDTHKRDLYREERLKFDQANLARQLKYSTGAWMLLDKKPQHCHDDSDQKREAELNSFIRKINENIHRRMNRNRWLDIVNGFWNLLGKGDEATSEKLQLEKDKRKILRVTKIRFVCKVRGEYRANGIGTLETHVNGFLYKDDIRHFQIDILYENINGSFCLVEDDRRMPLLHYTFHDHITVGATRLNDIQFRWISKTSGDALSFFNSAQPACLGRVGRGPFEKLYMESKFYGKLPGDDNVSIFYVTYFSLVRLEEAPSIMIGLFKDIEIVNLAEVIPGEIEMTIIPRDFKRGVVIRINSIPLESLSVLKNGLNSGFVKFYENKVSLDWEEIVQSIIDSPEDFMKNGGWNSFDLEKDSGTLDYYSDSSHIEYGDIIIG